MLKSLLLTPVTLQGNLAGCVSRPLGEEAGAVLARETLKADPEALARLMADHTQVGALVSSCMHGRPCCSAVRYLAALLAHLGLL